MTPLFLARRSAERFDSLVEGGRRDEVDPATAELLELVGGLRSTARPQPRPEFSAELREQLMVAARTELIPSSRERSDVERLTITPRGSHRERRLAVALGAFAVVGATTSMAVASQSAIPGDALYPLKRAIESTQAGFSTSDDAKGKTILDDASVRLDEVDQLSEQKQPNAGLVTQTLNTFTQQFTEGSNALLADYEANGHEASIDQIHQNAQHGIAALSGLQAVVPEAAHGALLNAAQTLFHIDANATTACPSCGAGLTELPAQLVAAASASLNGVAHAAGGATPGVPGGTATEETPSTSTSSPPPSGNGVKSGSPNGLHAPENPVSIPPAAPTSDSGVGDVLAGSGTTTQGDGGGTADGSGSDGATGSGGKGGKGNHHVAVDLAPVTAAVNQALTGVADGVNGLLNGLGADTGTGK